ncbi:MAG: tRNA-intron lyase [Candidatus Thorarchaeota archaeon]
MSEISSEIEGQLVNDRTIVWNPDHSSMLYRIGYFGQPVGIRKPKSPDFEKPLQLSLLESIYLSEEGILVIKNAENERILEKTELIQIGLEKTPDFKVRYRVYSELRKRGYVVRPGLKFGTDFAVYEEGPGEDHAPFMVHVIPQKKGVDPLDIVRASRLATSVRKKFIIATVEDRGDIGYYSFEWFRP